MISLWSASCVLARVVCPSSDGIMPLFSIEHPLKGPVYDNYVLADGPWPGKALIPCIYTRSVVGRRMRQISLTGDRELDVHIPECQRRGWDLNLHHGGQRVTR